MKLTIQKIDRQPAGDENDVFEHVRIVATVEDFGIAASFTVYDGVRQAGRPIPSDISEIATDRIRRLCKDILTNHPAPQVRANTES